MDRLSLHRLLGKQTNQEAKEPNCSLPKCVMPKCLMLVRMHKGSQPQGVWNWIEGPLEFDVDESQEQRWIFGYFKQNHRMALRLIPS